MAEHKITEILSQRLPQAPIQSLDISLGNDFAGDPALFIKVVFRKWPDRADARTITSIEHEFRVWFAALNPDSDRFPYFRFSSMAEEREKAAIKVDVRS